MKRIFGLSLLVISLAGGAQKKVDPASFAKTISPEDLKKHLFIVASREMEGRETASPGQKKAAAYIESQFQSLGLLPGNNGSYQMNYGVYQDSLLQSYIEVNGKRFELDKDFIINVGQSSTSTLRCSEVVFAGSGIVDSTRDDYKGLDVRGKVVLLIGTNPPQQGGMRGFNPFSRVDAAQKNGAVAVLVVGGSFPRSSRTSPKGNMYVNAFQRIVRPNQYQVSEKLAQAIMGEDYGKAKTGGLAPRPYSTELTLSFAKTSTNLESSNVVGLLEGSDLKDEYVFITAHYDHLGKRDTVIYYGADDDGSGTVGVLEIAEAFVKAKQAGKGPRRSIVFMTVSGEEKGLWGSAYYANHPIFPLDKTTVDLNIDMIGRVDTSRHKGDTGNYVYVVGDDKLSTDLKPISEAVNKKFTKLELDYKYNDPNDRQRIYFRSDHYNFADKGVPIIFYYDGMLGSDYHRPTDTPDKINYNLLAKRAQLVFFTAWEMANRNDMLKRDLKLEVPPRGF